MPKQLLQLWRRVPYCYPFVPDEALCLQNSHRLRALPCPRGRVREIRAMCLCRSKCEAAAVIVGLLRPHPLLPFCNCFGPSACVATKRKADSLDVDVVDKPMTSDQQVKYAREIGTSRPTKLARDSAIQSHPSRGGSQGFPVSERCFLIDYWVNKLPVPKSRIRSIQRWIKNGVLPLRQSGNKVNSTIRGEHLLLLAMFKKIYPQASNPESACYIAEHSTDGRVLTNGEVTKGLRFLNMTRKKGSTTAYQAFTPKNMWLHYCFWNCKAPGGIMGIPRHLLTDGDEMAIMIDDANQSYGHAVKGARVCKVGHYGRG